MRIEKLRKLAQREEIDYPLLLSLLSHYASPRDKISAWLQSGDLIRVKKGIYIFGREAALIPYSQELLANLIYGPSAISMSYALSFYGLIPERVTTITSITLKRNKSFSTPIGDFTYHYLNPDKYPIGIELKTISKNLSFLIASPEKALCDHLYLTDKKVRLHNLDDVHHYLLDDLRIDENALQKCKTNDFIKISQIYKDQRLGLLAQFVKKWKR